MKLHVVVNKRKKSQSKKTWTRTIIIKILYWAVVRAITRGDLMHLEFKVKIDYLILNTKLLLININYVGFFIFKKFYKHKKFDKTFRTG